MKQGVMEYLDADHEASAGTIRVGMLRNPREPAFILHVARGDTIRCRASTLPVLVKSALTRVSDFAY
jgi:hypothetical protein